MHSHSKSPLLWSTEISSKALPMASPLPKNSHPRRPATLPPCHAPTTDPSFSHDDTEPEGCHFPSPSLHGASFSLVFSEGEEGSREGGERVFWRKQAVQGVNQGGRCQTDRQKTLYGKVVFSYFFSGEPAYTALFVIFFFMLKSHGLFVDVSCLNSVVCYLLF